MNTFTMKESALMGFVSQSSEYEDEVHEYDESEGVNAHINDREEEDESMDEEECEEEVDEDVLQSESGVEELGEDEIDEM